MTHAQKSALKIGLATLCISQAMILGAAAQNAPAAQAQPVPVQKTSFCVEAESLYTKIINAPLQAQNLEKASANAVTYSIYRNMAAQRVLTMAWGARCDLTLFLREEANHLAQLK